MLWRHSLHFVVLSWIISLSAMGPIAVAEQADWILHRGKVVTVDQAFSIHQAVAVKDGRIVMTGTDEAALKLRGDKTQVIDLAGAMVLPGLMDSHTHPTGAAMFEFDHEIPSMESIAQVLDYVKKRTQVLDEGEWIFISQVFITRLKERRYPTKAELDAVAPKHPVMFRTGPDGMLNSLALKLSGIEGDYQVTDGGTGFVERDEKGEITGILRSCTRLAKYRPPKGGKSAGEQDRYRRLRDLLADYNAVGLTAIADRDASTGAMDLYEKLLGNQELSVRVAASRSLGTGGHVDAVRMHVRKIAEEKRVKGGDDMLRIVGVKSYLDGGMLTGSAYMRQPWGVSKIYSITDPKYQGLRFIPQEKLVPIVREAIEHGLQFTAHSVGDGAVAALIDAYEEIDKVLPAGTVAKVRPCITHCNFMSEDSIARMSRLGIVADIQPVWLFLDAATLNEQFGHDRLRWFQPLRSLMAAKVTVGGGSDHMQKIGSMRSVNPYNPWLGLWTTIARRPRNYEGPFHPEEALSREQAIRFYTINNARIMFLDGVAGSLEKGKFADMIVIDRDLLSCPEEEIKETQVLRTYLQGRLVHERK